MKHILTLSLLAIATVGCTSTPVQEKTTVATTQPDFVQDMTLVWGDEFNSQSLDKAVWSGNYYSTFDMAARTNYEELRADQLPQPAMRFTDSTIVLYTNDAEPQVAYWKDSGRKISSIQTYDWNSDRNGMGAEYVGGYIEARIRRSATPEASMVNGAFWLDSPGPDLKYYVQSGDKALEVEGIRPQGQIFEIDLCEYITTEIVLHGNVDPNGEFKGNIGHAIIPGDFQDRWVVHGMLWSPAGLKFYIDGKQVAQWWDPNKIKSPNHYMNLYLGMYAKGGQADLEADYVHLYQWKNSLTNQLPNGDFEYVNSLFPWEGTGTLSKDAARNGSASGLVVGAGEKVVQYIYLDHSADHKFELWSRGDGEISIKIENIEAVNGKATAHQAMNVKPTKDYSATQLKFTTEPDLSTHKRTVRVTLENATTKPVEVDDISIVKI